MNPTPPKWLLRLSAIAFVFGSLWMAVSAVLEAML